MSIHRSIYVAFLLQLIWPVALSGQSLRPAGQQQLVISLTDQPEAVSPLEGPDSLLAIRHLLSTTISQRGQDLPKASIIQILNATPVALTAYKRGKILQPVGPVLLVSGVVLSYIGLQGKTESGYIRPIRTPTNPNAPDYPVDYTVRSLPQVLGGIGLIVGGICLIELSNGLLTKSVKLHNDRVIPRRLRLQNIKVGMTTSGRVGLTASF